MMVSSLKLDRLPRQARMEIRPEIANDMSNLDCRLTVTYKLELPDYSKQVFVDSKEPLAAQGELKRPSRCLGLS